jgi:hypothetical protein
VRRGGQQHLVAAQQAGRHGEQAGRLDQPRPRPGASGAAELGLQGGAESHRAATEHDEARDHDPRIPGVSRGQAADLHLGGGMAGLQQ